MEAIAPMAQAARLAPTDSRIAHDLGLICLEADRPKDAIAAFRRALAINPAFAEASWRLGIAYAKLGDNGAALASLERALASKPSLVEARFLLAGLLVDTGRVADAVIAFRKVASSASNAKLGRLAEARALQLVGDDTRMEVVLQQILHVDPKSAAALELLGGHLANVGDFDGARSCFQRALDLNPRMIGLWYDLVRCRRFMVDDAPLLERMRVAALRSGLEAMAAARLHLAIGKALDDLGNPGEAMRAFDTASELRSGSIGFDLTRWEANVDETIQRFTSGVIASTIASASRSEAPVFILGLPRSGTTLIEQMLSNHPRIAAAGELTFWRLRAKMLAASGLKTPDESFIASAAADYLAYIQRLAPTAERVTDKLPFNFLWAGLIHATFPMATIIHCRRQAIDTALSIHQTWFTGAVDFPTGGDELVAYVRGYDRLMAHWRDVLPSKRFIEIDYEDLVAAPEPQIRRLVAATGLVWNTACLYPERNDRVVKTASKWQARQAINASSVGRWLRYEPYLGRLAALV